jgi:hypothetical protein
MIVNFRTSAWDREPGMTVFATKARQHEPQIRAERAISRISFISLLHVAIPLLGEWK